MQITLSFDNFTELPYTSGTIQNISSQATVEICQDDTVNSGLILGPGEWFSWSNSTIYARSAWDYEPTAICAVVPFKKGEEGGGGSEYILPVASKSTLGGVKSSDEAGAIKVDGFGKMTYNAPTVEPISAPDWETGTIYPANALVTYNDNVYLCLTAHTSGIFAEDLANGKWKLVSMTLSVATSSKLGGVKSNSADGGVTVDSDGKMTIKLPKATSSTLGGVKIGSGLSVTTNGTLSTTSSGAYIARDILWEGNAYDVNTVLNLSYDYTEYDLIIIYEGETSLGDRTNSSTIMNPHKDAKAIVQAYTDANYDVRYDLVFSAKTATIVLAVNGMSGIAVRRIEGIKFLPNPNNYSTTEREIGTWIDGKKLYQVTLSGATPNTSAETNIYTLNADECIEITGYCKFGDEFVYLPQWYSDNNFSYLYYNRLSGNIMMKITNPSYQNIPMYITIKYTKA